MSTRGAVSVALLAGIVALLNHFSTEAPAEKVPDGLAEFCSVIETNRTSYYNLKQDKRAAENQHNDLRAEQLGNQMTSTVQWRNQQVFRTQKAREFEIDHWPVVIKSVETSFILSDKVVLRMRPVCSPTTTITAYIKRSESDVVSMLSRKSKGDRLTITGKLVQFVKKSE